MLTEGARAPDFELLGVYDDEVDTYRLSDYTESGEWVVLTFYAFDFEPICTEGMCALRDAEFFQFEDDFSVLGVSGDGIYAHRRFAAEHAINYPLLSDTGRDVAAEYDILQSDYEGMQRVHERALFVVDDDQVVRFATSVDVDSPEDIDLAPVVDAVKQLRA